jgi:hypothetical protein
MAASATTAFPVPHAIPAVSVTGIRASRRRITPEAGRALEKLGHAIEYLTDELVHRGDTLSASNPDMAAMQLLMALNRQIYFECPEVATFGARLRTWLSPSSR